MPMQVRGRISSSEIFPCPPFRCPSRDESGTNTRRGCVMESTVSTFQERVAWILLGLGLLVALLFHLVPGRLAGLPGLQFTHCLGPAPSPQALDQQEKCAPGGPGNIGIPGPDLGQWPGSSPPAGLESAQHGSSRPFDPHGPHDGKHTNLAWKPLDSPRTSLTPKGDVQDKTHVFFEQRRGEVPCSLAWLRPPAPPNLRGLPWVESPRVVRIGRFTD